MAGGNARIIALALALSLGGPAVHAARVVDPATARQAIANPAVIARDAELTSLATGNRATELAARLEVIARDPAITDVAQEWLLDRGLHAIARIAPTSEARAAVARLSARRPTVYTRVDPDHGERATPLYDAGATARFVLRNWDRAAAREAARANLAAGTTAAVDRYAARGRIAGRRPGSRGNRGCLPRCAACPAPGPARGALGLLRSRRPRRRAWAHPRRTPRRPRSFHPRLRFGRRAGSARCRLGHLPRARRAIRTIGPRHRQPS